MTTWHDMVWSRLQACEAGNVALGAAPERHGGLGILRNVSTCPTEAFRAKDISSEFCNSGRERSTQHWITILSGVKLFVAGNEVSLYRINRGCAVFMIFGRVESSSMPRATFAAVVRMMTINVDTSTPIIENESTSLMGGLVYVNALDT